MTIEQNQQNEMTPDASGPGEMLRQARESMGLSQEDVANRLRLRTTIIADIEDNQLSNSSQTMFTRGYIRSYAKLVHLDEDLVLSKYMAVESLPEQDHKMHSFSKRTKREAHDNQVMKLTWVIAAVMVGVTALWWWQSIQLAPEPTPLVSERPEVADVLPTLTQDTLVAESVDDTPVVTPALVDEVASAISAATSTDVVEETVDPVTAFIEEAKAEAQQAVLEQEQAAAEAEQQAETVADVVPEIEVFAPGLSIAFTGDCWVDIRDGNGKRLVTGIKKQGETLELEGVEPFKLVLGAPDVVELRHNGKIVDLSDFGAGRVARFTLPQ